VHFICNNFEYGDFFMKTGMTNASAETTLFRCPFNSYNQFASHVEFGD
jgi:hypothetical protein